MPALLYGLFAWAFGGLIQMVLVGAGITVIVFAGLQPLVETLLNQVVTNINGLPSTALQILLLSGIGEALSIIGSAILTRLSFNIASKSFSLRMPTGK